MWIKNKFVSIRLNIRLNSSLTFSSRFVSGFVSIRLIRPNSSSNFASSISSQRDETLQFEYVSIRLSHDIYAIRRQNRSARIINPFRSRSRSCLISLPLRKPVPSLFWICLRNRPSQALAQWLLEIALAWALGLFSETSLTFAFYQKPAWPQTCIQKSPWHAPLGEMVCGMKAENQLIKGQRADKMKIMELCLIY